MKGLLAAGKKLERKGRKGDTVLAHINPEEARLLKARGGSGSTNPATGLLEFYDSDRSGSDDDGDANDRANQNDRNQDAANDRATGRDADDAQQGRELTENGGGLGALDRDHGFSLTDLNTRMLNEEEADKRYGRDLVSQGGGINARGQPGNSWVDRNILNDIINDPFKSAINFATGLALGPVAGAINSVSGRLGGPTVGGSVTAGLRDLTGYDQDKVASAPGGVKEVGPSGGTMGWSEGGVDERNPTDRETPVIAASGTPMPASNAQPRGLLADPDMTYLQNQPARPKPNARFNPSGYLDGTYYFNPTTGRVDFRPN